MSDKYVLIVDVTSKGCFDCPAHQWVDDDDGGEMLFCSAENWRKPVTHTPIPAREALERPSWCPLRPLPKKIEGKQAKYMPAYALGRSDVIDEITGEEE